MESDHRYYWRRAAEELAAASRAITAAAETRHRDLAESYIARLRELGGTETPLPAFKGLSPRNPLPAARGRLAAASAD